MSDYSTHHYNDFRFYKFLKIVPRCNHREKGTSPISRKHKYKTNVLITNSFQTRHTYTGLNNSTVFSKTQKAKLSLNFDKSLYFLHTYIYTWLTKYLSASDNARDAVFLHVFASSERQECGNKTGPKQRTKHETLSTAKCMYRCVL